MEKIYNDKGILSNEKEFICKLDIEKLIEENSDILNIQNKNMKEQKEYFLKLQELNILSYDEKYYLSCGIDKLSQLIKISKKTIFEMIKKEELDSVKIGKPRLLLFYLNNYGKPIDEIRRLISNSITNEYRLACKYDKNSILKTIIITLELNSLKTSNQS
ncbi:hypothetical protein CRU99_13085 [Malaciobacter mytili]|uniref:hypothetical protein n=1 Tax=Malaciobacter mytili TaxID=603050 RepID=UPI00100A862D|nr:hypothetical protein [Malaciobacter mytili]RXI36935.1 hypothetical protein CRU99_13085 [Malaciobacter mytili]